MWDFLSGPFESVVRSVGEAVDALHTSEEEKAEFRRKLVEAERDFQRDILEAESGWAKTQSEVIRSEVSGKSYLARNWRPILMLTFTYIIAHNYVIAPVLGGFGLELAPTTIPPDMWALLKIGIGGYITGRSAEKILPVAMQAWGKRE